MSKSELKSLAEILIKFPDNGSYKDFRIGFVRFYIAYRIVHGESWQQESSFESTEYKLAKELIDLTKNLSETNSSLLLEDSLSWPAENFHTNLTICELLIGNSPKKQPRSGISAKFAEAMLKLTTEEQVSLAHLIFHFPINDNLRSNARFIRFYLAYRLVSGRCWPSQKFDIAYKSALSLILFANQLPTETSSQLLKSAIFNWPITAFEENLEIAKLLYQD